MKILRLFGCICFFVSTAGMASGQATRESVVELMELTQASSMVDAMSAEVGQMFEGVAKQMGVTEAEQPAFDKYMKKVAGIMQEDMSWEQIREPTIDIYVRNFSEEEIQGLIEFYQSDIGKSMIKKMPIVIQESMGITQGMFKDAMPKIHALAAEMQSEIAALRKQAEAD